MFKPSNLPEDFDRLEKGDILTQPNLRGLIGEHLGLADCDLDRWNYQKALNHLQEALEHRLWSLGKPYTVRCIHGDLEILDDSTAAKYNARHAKGYIKRSKKSHYRNLQVDTGNLSDKDRAVHLRELEVMGATIAGMIGARKTIKRIVYERNTPGSETYKTNRAEHG